MERHIRGKWACAKCQTLTQAPVAAHVIDKGIPTAGLLAQVLVAKYADHQPLYRQENIWSRRSGDPSLDPGAMGGYLRRAFAGPLVDALKTEILRHRVLHGDETPVAMLKPGNGKTHRAYLWAYAPGAFEATRRGVRLLRVPPRHEHARASLGGLARQSDLRRLRGVQSQLQPGRDRPMLRHARRKFFDLHAANQSQIAEFALQQFARVYEIEREVQALTAPQRLQVRQQHSRPILDALHQWMVLQRQQVAGNSATAKALDYSLKRWTALTRFVDDPQLPPDNNWIENRIRPIALGRSNCSPAACARVSERRPS